MAQYFQVVSQDDEDSSDGRKFIHTNVENQSIQYVISQENQQQQLQGQQIVVSTDQIMVLENGQQVIVDSSGNAFQNAQYIIQEGVPTYSDIHPQAQPRQVYYTTGNCDRDQSVQVEQPIHQVSHTPIVLNHQLQQMGNQPSTNVQKGLPVLVTQARPTQLQQNRVAQALSNAALKQHSMQPRPSAPTVPQHSSVQQQQQPKQQSSQLHSTQIHIALTVPNALVQNPPQQKLLLNRIPLNSAGMNVPASSSTTIQRTNEVSSLNYAQTEIKTREQKNSDGDSVCFTDGTIMPLANYKVMMANTKKATNNTNVTSTSLNDELDTLQDATYSKGNQFLKSRGSRTGVRGGRSRRGNSRQIATNTGPMLLQSQQENVELKTEVHQRFISQQQLKMTQQQKVNLPQTQFMQHRQQHIHQQQAIFRQQQQQLQQQHQLQQQQQQLQQQQLHQQEQLQQQQLLQQSQPQQLQQEYVQPQFIIQPPPMHQTAPYSPLPLNIISRQILHILESTPASEEFPDSIRMLVLLENGEQRLITFTLPKENCTLQEILEQVGVGIQSHTRLNCYETLYPGIHYLVTVGLHPEHVAEQGETVTETMPSDAVESLPPNEMPSSPELLSETETPRCKYKLSSEVKTTPALHNGSDAVDKLKDRKITINLKNHVTDTAKTPNVNNTIKTNPEPEPDVLTLSSDEEECSDGNNLSETDQLLKRFNNSSVTLSAIKKEPTVTDLQQSMASDKYFSTAVKGGGKEEDCGAILASIKCRTIRIGSFKYSPRFDVIVKPLEVILKVPSVRDSSEIKTIIIERKHVAKVLVNFQKALPVIFYYVMPSLGETIRSELGMEKGSDIYFDPVSDEEAYKRITILPEIVGEDAKLALKEVYGKPPKIVMDELTTKEANDILVKTCPKEISKFVEATMGTRSFSPEVRQLLIYPPGKGGLPINTEDYMCLAQDQFLNDVIIDFYLKYLVLQLPQDQQAKVHIFSTFFYKRLTTKPVKVSRRSHPAELDPNLTPAQRRHARVEKWTKNVNLFEKDFIVVPINENCHWYLAIICFPSLDGTYTMDGRQVQIEQKRKVHNNTITIGAVTITNIKKEKEKPILCDDEEISDKDEAEGDESELESESSEESDNVEAVQLQKNEFSIPIKQPCILIFDSLAGASRVRVVATLRDYLTCEYKAKMGLDKVFSKDVIKGNCPKVPQQTNFTDCGLYLLQYVEHFLTNPIQNYRIPIKHLKHWFEEHVVTKKREDIAILIKNLMMKYNFDTNCLPVLTLPTLNGKVVDNFAEDEDELMHEYEDGDEEDDEEICDEASEYLNSSMETRMNPDEMHSDLEDSYGTMSNSMNSKDEILSEITLIPKHNSTKRSSDFLEETIMNESELKPDVSELQKQSSRETLSYLKAKRINRHKSSSELLDVKKYKPSYD